MSIFHKITTTALALSLVATLASCASEEETTAPDTADSSAESQVETQGETQGETQEETGEGSDATTETQGETDADSEEEAGEVAVYAQELFALLEQSEAVIDKGNVASEELLADLGSKAPLEDLTQALAELAEVEEGFSALAVPSAVSEVHKLFIEDYIQLLQAYDHMMNLLLTADLSDEESLKAELTLVLEDLKNISSNVDGSFSVLQIAIQSAS